MPDLCKRDRASSFQQILDKKHSARQTVDELKQKKAKKERKNRKYRFFS